MATHSSTLTWEIPWMEEPGRLQYGVTKNWTQLKQFSSSSTQYSCLGNPTDRGAWQATVHGWQRVRHDLATEQ